MYFTVLAYHPIKTKEREKIDRYQDLARELRNLWKMRAMLILIVVDEIRMIPLGLGKAGMEELEIRGRFETIQSTALSKTGIILRLLGT